MYIYIGSKELAVKLYKYYDHYNMLNFSTVLFVNIFYLPIKFIIKYVQVVIIKINGTVYYYIQIEMC